MKYDRFLTRVFDTENKQMHYQGDYKCGFTSSSAKHPELQKNEKFLGLIQEGILVHDVNFHTGGNPSVIPFVNNFFIPMQCTGMRDKDGRLIYEGDVVLCGSLPLPFKVVIFFEEDEAIFYADSRFSNTTYYMNELFDMKIIGNVHQNPNLLEAPNET